jgi:hypothetical protein
VKRPYGRRKEPSVQCCISSFTNGFFYHVPVTGNGKTISESKKQVKVHARNQLIATQCDL